VYGEDLVLSLLLLSPLGRGGAEKDEEAKEFG
jgi:hypothetical protein